MPRPEPATRPRLWLPRFNLATLFVLVTLASVGFWYRFQVPFEVRNVTYEQFLGKVDPLAPPGTPPPLVTGQVLRVEVESVRRVLSHDRSIVRHGPWRVFDAQDVLREEGHYIDGIRHGRFAEFSDSGQLQREQFFLRGELHGSSRRWNAQGRLWEETNYDSGVKHGRYLRSHADGEPEVEGCFEHGVPSGAWTWFTRIGPSRKKELGAITGQWTDGAPDGQWICRDEVGQPYWSGTFRRGKLLSSSAGPCEPRLAELLASRQLTDPDVIAGLLHPVSVAFDFTPATFVVALLRDQTDAPLVIGLRGRLTPSELAQAAAVPPPPTETYLQTFHEFTRLRVLRDARFPHRRIEMKPPAAGPLQEVAATEWPLSGTAERVPLLVALGRLLPLQDLACDYRYQALWIDRADAIAAWKDPTGVNQLRPRADSHLAAVLDKAAFAGMDFRSTRLQEALIYLRGEHDVSIDFSSLPPALQFTPVTIKVREPSFRNCLGLLLESAGCEATLRGDTIVVSPKRLP